MLITICCPSCKKHIVSFLGSYCVLVPSLEPLSFACGIHPWLCVVLDVMALGEINKHLYRLSVQV